MYTHPYAGGQLDRQRRRDMQAQADEQRLGLQLRDPARKSQPAQRHQRRRLRASRPALRLRLPARA
jgi:hypothetical protein